MLTQVPAAQGLAHAPGSAQAARARAGASAGRGCADGACTSGRSSGAAALAAYTGGMSCPPGIPISLALLALAPAPGAALPCPLPAVDPREDVFRALSFDQACEAARREAKPVLIAFFAAGCGPCEAYDLITFADEKVRSWIEERVVAVRCLDYAADAARFEVSGQLTLVFATAEGEEIDRIEHYLDPEPFIRAADEVLEGRSAVSKASRAVAQAPVDPRARLDLAKALLLRKRHRAALPAFLWVLDETRGDPAWQEERLGFVLRRIGLLRRNLADATLALEERRDRAAACLLEPSADPAPAAELELCARELVAFNQELGELEHTLETWDALRSRSDVPRAALTTLLDRTTQLLLLGRKRYADLLDGIGDPLAVLQEGLAQLQLLKAEGELDSSKRALVHRQRLTLLDEVGRVYHALLGAGREQDAAVVVEMFLGLERVAATYEALISAAIAVEREDLARALTASGLESLPEGPEREQLRRFTRSLFKEGR